MVYVMIVPAKGKGFLEDLMAIEKADGDYVDVGWFEEQGHHPTARDTSGVPYTFPDLAKFHASGGGGVVPVRDVLKAAQFTLKPSDMKKFQLALDKWLDDPTRDPDKVLFPMLGKELGQHIKSVFGGPFLHPTPDNPDPLIDSGELMDHTAFRVKGDRAQEV